MAARRLRVFLDYAVSYDLHGVDGRANDHARVDEIMRALTKLTTVSEVEQQEVSTLWHVRTTKTGVQLRTTIRETLQAAKGRGTLTARSVTLLVVRVSGDFLVAEYEL